MGMTETSRPSARTTRRGMAMIWVITTIAIIAALAAVAAPYLAAGSNSARYSDTAATMRALAAGVVTFQTQVQDGQKSSVKNYPGQLSQLSSIIVAGDKNSCQGAMTTAIPSKGTTSDSITWANAGPFVSFMFPAIGLVTPIGTILDSVPNRGPTPGTTPIYALISGVSATDAAGFDAYVDNGTGDTVTVLHAAVNDTTTLTYRLVKAGINGIC